MQLRPTVMSLAPFARPRVAEATSAACPNNPGPEGRADNFDQQQGCRRAEARAVHLPAPTPSSSSGLPASTYEVRSNRTRQLMRPVGLGEEDGINGILIRDGLVVSRGDDHM